MKQYVIYSESEEGFWSNVDGWVNYSNATFFKDYPSSIPMTKQEDAIVFEVEPVV